MADETKPVVEDASSQEETGTETEAEQENGVVTMLDVLNEQAELEENAEAVLGGSDDKHCSYFMGYVKRQALYSCKTCIEKDSASTRGGICLACSLHCHQGHEFYELYTKRNFRCDCGVSTKFPQTPCTIYPNKGGLNELNQYNHNFEGRYCTCDRPYPDPDNDRDEQMIQCIICEDWFHANHLNADVPDDDDYAEMICGGCMVNLPFLWSYYSRPSRIVKKRKVEEGSSSGDAATTVKEEKPETKVDLDNQDSGFENSSDSAKVVVCKLVKKEAGELPKGPTFWDEGWRKMLCLCNECLKLYDEKNVSYLTDVTDTCHHYEKEGKEKNTPADLWQRGLSAINGMPRTQQVEMLQGYNDLKTQLSEYLRQFAESGRVVTPADITRFFEELKRSRAESDIELPYSCR